MTIRLILVLAILCTGAYFAHSLHQRRGRLAKQNTRYVAMSVNLRQRVEGNAHLQTQTEERIRDLELKAANTLQSSVHAPTQAPTLAASLVPPDVTRHGGWPKGVDYFYFPKSDLQYLSFDILNAQRLSDEAATVYNLSESERQEVDRALGELFAQFRSTEIESMQEIELPVEWTHGQFSSGVAYHIPSFSAEVAAWRQGLQQHLESTLGSERSALLGSAIDMQLRENWNDLGASARTVGFVWHPETNGTESLWSANQDQRNGDGTFRRYLPGGPDEATFRHYADLFGIQLPER